MSVSMRVVTALGGNFTVDVDPNGTVGDAQDAIAESQGMPPGTVSLEYMNDAWDDRTVLLCETGWDVDEEVTLMTRPPFRVGQRLEARDRLTAGYLCVATIEEVDGRRVKIHFDGWTDRYDYWTDDDHPDLAPIGTCEELGYFLERPKNYGPTGHFELKSWHEYLEENGYTAAPRACFAAVDYFSGGPHKSRRTLRLCRDSPPSPPASSCREPSEPEPSNSVHDDPPCAGTTLFEVGMAFEARDRRNPRLWCPAYVKDVDGRRVRVSFIGWGPTYDYWAVDSSSDIKPCRTTGASTLQKPRGRAGSWVWDDTLQGGEYQEAPRDCFTEA